MISDCNFDARLIETDDFPFEFLSDLAERESWRKEIHRPIYHVHKWWAKRLGSVFRGVLLGCVLPRDADLIQEFYLEHSFADRVVLDPFMGSGTTIGEAHKLGFTALGRDINPVAVNAVRAALGPLDSANLQKSFHDLSRRVGEDIRALYRSTDSGGHRCDVLYYFWVMQATCPCCHENVALFPSWVVARNAYPHRKPAVQVLCPRCGDIFPWTVGGISDANCPSCTAQFAADTGIAHGGKARCPSCQSSFSILRAMANVRPTFRLYGKLVLTASGSKEYLTPTLEDMAAYEECGRELKQRVDSGEIVLPSLPLADGHNTRQAMGYGFLSWSDFFNDRQLLALGKLHRAIAELPDTSTRDVMLTLFSGILEFNNLFASYKGEGTGAVRHMFSHHILKPERTPIEANVWGTPKSSGSFSNLFRRRLLGAIAYREAPTEIDGKDTTRRRICSPPFTGKVSDWPNSSPLAARAVYLSCADSSQLQIPDRSVNYIVTDPPFFDNVHYSELADFFHSWQQLTTGNGLTTTRSPEEVQDTDAGSFAQKLCAVFKECHRVLTDDGMLVFTYHHSRDDGWMAVIDAILQAGFIVVNSHPIKAEMSVATPKSQAKEPIQLDIIIVSRKATSVSGRDPRPVDSAIEVAKDKLKRLQRSFRLSRNDMKVVLYGQLLTTVRSVNGMESIAPLVDAELAALYNSRDLVDAETKPRRNDGTATDQLSLWDTSIAEGNTTSASAVTPTAT